MADMFLNFFALLGFVVMAFFAGIGAVGIYSAAKEIREEKSTDAIVHHLETAHTS